MNKILIADDHGIVRRGLKEILSDAFPDAEIAEAGDGTGLIRKAREGGWNIIISDLSMPDRNGLETLKQLRTEYPKIPVLILSMHPENQYAIRSLKAGAAGYLTKNSASEELVTAVKYILGGRKYISPSLAEKLAELLDQDPSQPIHQRLSDREFDVLKLIASGKTVSEIAGHLSVSVTTVSTYRSRILAKMNMKSNAELTHYAIENKLA